MIDANCDTRTWLFFVGKTKAGQTYIPDLCAISAVDILVIENHRYATYFLALMNQELSTEFDKVTESQDCYNPTLDYQVMGLQDIRLDDGDISMW